MGLNVALNEEIINKKSLKTHKFKLNNFHKTKRLVRNIESERLKRRRRDYLANNSRPNAAVFNNMAPALTEPLSPSEKLSSSTATTTPTTRSSKRQHEALATATTTINPSTSDTESSSNNTTVTATTPIHKERRARHTAQPTTSTRVTRSKDAYQRVFEEAVTNNSTANQANNLPATTNSPTDSTPKNNSKTNNNNINNNNEQMGVSPALITNKNNNNNNNNNNNSESECKKEENNQELNLLNTTNCKENDDTKDDNSTAQLLADLTSDIEEAITADICLRNQFLVKENNAGGIVDCVGGSETKVPIFNKSNDNLIFTAGCAETIPDTELLLHMESSTTEAVGETLKSNNELNQQNTNTQLKDNEEEEEQKAQHTMVQGSETAETAATTSIAATLESQTIQKPDVSRALILSVEELPPISTDSTMTASEVEDNLEERLSQLDGTAIVSAHSCADVSSAAASLGIALSMTPTTPPRTPTHQHATLQQQVQQLQQQLQHTPPTPISLQVQQQALNTFTPQSTTSTVNTLSSANLPQASGGELEDQDIEEMLKALKGFDGTTGADTLGDLNVLFNEVYTSLNYEEISSQPTSSISKPNPLKEMQAEIEKKQLSMQRKIDFLTRRMRKVQARYMCKHTSEEISGLFEWSARLANKGGSSTVCNVDQETASTSAAAALAASSIISARPPALNWAEEKKNPVSSTQMSAMLRKLETVANAQQLCTTNNNNNTTSQSMGSSSLSNAYSAQLKRSKKSHDMSSSSLAAASTTATTNIERRGDAAMVVVPTFDVNVAEEITHVAGLLQTEMREVQNAIDSDATESSSGAESADEMVTYNNQIQQPLSIAKRAAWRYSRDRAVIASRWSWLLSQIADLEIKIRQHSELHQDIVRTKGPVVSGYEGNATKNMDSTAVPLVAAAASAAASTSVNGYKGDLNLIAAPISHKQHSEEMMDTSEALPGSCRTRGYVPTQFRMRKILQTTNIHTISKKASRPSTIKCGCQWPLYPCTLCTGRTDPTAPRDLPDTMMMSDRVALLDPGYHPVLSFPEDVSSTIHIEAIARLPEWQQRVMRCQVKSIAKSIWKAEREAVAAAGHHHHHGTARKYKTGGEPGTKRRYIKKRDRLLAEAAAAASVAAMAAPTGAAAASTSSDVAAGAGVVGGNGIGTLSTSTTPLVANKLTKNSKKMHCHLVGDGVLLEPSSPAAATAAAAAMAMPTNNYNTNNSSISSQSLNSSNYIHQTSDYPLPQKYEKYNPNQIHSSLISNHHHQQQHQSHHSSSSTSKSSKNRKLSTTSNAFYPHHHHHHHNNHHYNNNNNNQYYNSNGGNSGSNEMNFLHTNDNWDFYGARSRTSSPTHGSSSSYHKYERTLDRKNRSSYDIDNIVIPYSVAATTRVEILPYKEIPTPKWRIIDGEKTGESATTNNEDIAADVTNEATTSTTPVLVSTNGLQTEKENTAESSTNTEILKDSIPNNVEAKNLVNDLEKIASAADTNSNDLADVAEKVEQKKTNNNILNEVNATANSNKMHEPKLQQPQQQILVEEKKLNNTTVAENAPAATTTTQGCQEEPPTAKKPKTDNETESSIMTAVENALPNVTRQATEAATTTITSTIVEPPPPPTTIAGEEAEEEEETNTTTNDVEKSLEQDCDSSDYVEEDITDEAMMLRHERALTEERRKFQTYLKFPWSTRSRANRRIDSRAESSGANTPDPASPAPQTPSGGGDQESIPSPLAPSTPSNPLDNITEIGETAVTPAGNSNTSLSGPASIINCINKRYERRRTTSTKKDRELERRSSTPDPKELIPPYESLKFPLTDEVFDNLLRIMPSDYQQDDYKYLEDCYYNNTNIKITRNNNNNKNINRFSMKNDTFAATIKRSSTSNTTTTTTTKSLTNCDVVSSTLMMMNKNRKVPQHQQQSKLINNNINAKQKTVSVSADDGASPLSEEAKSAATAIAGGGGVGVNKQQENVQLMISNNNNNKSNNNNINIVGVVLNNTAAAVAAAATTTAAAANAANNNNDDEDENDDVDEEDDDDDNEMLEEEYDEDDYPRHHLAPPPNDKNDGSGVYGGYDDDDDDDEYGAYVGGGGRARRRGVDSEADSSDTEPFQDDDPNDPEWKGDHSERTEKARKKI